MKKRQKTEESTAETSNIVRKIEENKPNKGGTLKGESLEKADETKKNRGSHSRS